ncbi:MAG: hydantoinase/oxoprolinase family protein [Thermodesulfobacteriota bacterium]|nr:hydantoinase/oxoprolinase family protein [Thermodesulfobacteriota bacterium]
MIIGIDIGGTHTDAVCIKDRAVFAVSKVITGANLVESIISATQGLNIDYADIKRVALSTTLSTNAIITGDYAPTGMIISAGPGIDPKTFFLNDNFHLVDGAVDHRGREFTCIDPHQISRVCEDLEKKGIKGIGIVSKFSTRNPVHERQIHDMASERFQYLTLGNHMGGGLGFPRRINTTFLNTAVMPLHEKFSRSVKDALSRLGIKAPLFFLKADGGTYAFSAAGRIPVETIMSGPAASMMGGIALHKDSGNTLVLDIGGTTTDIGLLVENQPVFEIRGAKIGGLKTLVRGLNMVSVGAGGDSAVSVEKNTLCVGPKRKGVPCAMGGDTPTPMDALAVLGEFDRGDLHSSAEAIDQIASMLNTDRKKTAQEILRTMTRTIKDAADALIKDINAHPVYTVHEMLHPEEIHIDKIMVIGAPAEKLKKYIEEAFSLKCVVPRFSTVANALGAALARTTAEITLLADTQYQKVLCPELDIDEKIQPGLSLDDLGEMGRQRLRQNAERLGLEGGMEMDILDAQSFNMVRGFSTAGRNMRLKVQTRPGLIAGWRGEA